MSRQSPSCIRPWIGGLVAVGVVVLLASPAAGDWLVLNDGSRIETNGPWNERGRMVVFVQGNGTLVSLRLDDVDLDASRQATQEAQELAQRPAPPPPPPAPSVFRLTDADVGHIEDGEEPPGDQPATDDAPLAESTGITVTEWEQIANAADDGSAVSGTLENRGADAAAGITIVVTAYAVDGEVLSAATAQLGTGSLMPGETTRLIANFPGIFDISAVDFDIQQQSFAVRAAEDDE